jgi:hypothetical protein
MRRIFALAFTVAMAASATALRAEPRFDLLNGAWQQIASNAGACPTCEISIEGIGTLAVTANNGWSAGIVAQERDGLATAAGSGRWRRPNGPLDGRPFNVDFELRGERLHMTMRIDLGGGKAQTVKAVYGRRWLGS